MDSPAAQPTSVLDRYRDAYRPVVVLGPRADDPPMVKQRQAWVGPQAEAGIKDRDIIVIEVVEQGDSHAGDTNLSAADARQLRQTLNGASDEFAVLLIGRDGGIKARWDQPVAAQEIFGRVDAMPMRQQEVQTRGGGHAE